MSSALKQGTILAGKFRVERVLGSGGMGVVVATTQIDLDRLVAIKLLHPHVLDNQEAIARFLREARAAGRLKSEHVVQVLDVGTLAHGEPYMVMEYLDGRDLSEVVEARGPLPVQTAVDYVLQACEAIAEAHAVGIVHRDLKPSNLFLTSSAFGAPRVKVLDFGISKVVDAHRPSSVTGTSAVIGSPAYMSPEQMKASRNVDGRADIWSLGAILYELLAAKPAWSGETPPEIYASILKDPPPCITRERPDVPAEVEAVVLRCLEKEPSLRYQSVAALSRDLSPFASEEGRLEAYRIRSMIPPSAAHDPGYRAESAPDLHVDIQGLPHAQAKPPLQLVASAEDGRDGDSRISGQAADAWVPPRRHGPVPRLNLEGFGVDSAEVRKSKLRTGVFVSVGALAIGLVVAIIVGNQQPKKESWAIVASAGPRFTVISTGPSAVPSAGIPAASSIRSDANVP